MKTYKSRKRRVWVIVLSTIAIIGVLLGLKSVADYRQVVGLIEDRLMAQARVVDENLTANLLTVSLALENIRHELNDIPPQQFDNFLKGQCDRMPGVRSLLVIDELGRCLHSSREELVGLDFSKRDYFITVQKAPDRNILFLSQPFKSVLGPYILNITKPITGKPGEFRGVITASLSQEYFQTLLKSTIFAPDNRIALIHSDGTVFTAIPDEKNSIVGRNLMKPGSLLYRHIQEGKSASIQSGKSATTSDNRVFAYITNSSKDLRVDKHLIVAASRNLGEVLAHWMFSLGLQLSLYLLLSSTGIFITWRMLQRGAELARTAEYNRALMDSFHSHIAILDQDGVIVSVNDAWKNFAECNRTADGKLPRRCAVGTSYLEVCRESSGDYSDEAREAHDGISAVLAGKTDSFSLEYPCHSPITQRWFMMKAEPLRLESGGAVVAHIDISDLKRTYQQLQQRELDIKSVLDNMPAMIGYWNHDLRCSFGNYAYHGWFGIDPGTMSGKHIREVIGEERYQLNLPYIEGALRGEAQFFERAIPAPDGETSATPRPAISPTSITARLSASMFWLQISAAPGRPNLRLNPPTAPRVSF